MRRSDRGLVIENQEIYMFYRERLINLALSQFEWQGLPPTCDRNFLERRLLYTGQACFCKPTGTDFWMTLGILNRDSFNVYGYPKKIYGIGFNAENIETDEWEIIYDNMTFTTLLPKIDLCARLLWEIHNTYRCNLMQQNTPYICVTDKDTKMQFINFFNRLLGFEPVIYVKKGKNIDDVVKVFNTNVEFRGDSFQAAIERQWAWCVSAILGISPQTIKKERLTTDELMMNREEHDIAQYSRLLQRVQVCNKLRERDPDTFGNLSVNIASNLNVQLPSITDTIPQTGQTDPRADEGRGGNGGLYDIG